MQKPTPVKKWLTAKSRDNHQRIKNTNETVEVQYHVILKRVKKLIAGKGYSCFERGFKNDHTHGSEIMYAFICPTFYWQLTCDMFYYVRVEYAFNNCAFESNIRQLMHYYPFQTRAKEVTLKPDYDTFYIKVLEVQPSQYVTTNL